MCGAATFIYTIISGIMEAGDQIKNKNLAHGGVSVGLI